MLDVLDLNDGRHDGNAVTVQTVAGSRDVGLLERMARVLPDDAMRSAALERWVRVRIAELDPAELGGEVDEVVRRLVKTGYNAVPR